MTLSNRSVMAWVLLAAIGATAARAADDDVARVGQQFREFCLRESTDRGERILDDVELPKASVRQAAKFETSLRTDGSWGDVDYDPAARSAWRPFDHLSRVLALTVYARRASTPADESRRAIEAVHRALGYWIAHDYQCPNWWYNQIGVPKVLGTVGILLGDDLNAEERTYITKVVMPRAKLGAMTGQNRVWLAANNLMCGVIEGDADLVGKAAAIIREEVRVGTEEGVQPDWSFHQHGPQQQFGNYGMAFAVEMTRWAAVLRGTKFAFPDDKLAILRNYLLQGENWVVWRGAMDISACGRQLFPNSQWSKAGVIRGVMKTMEVVDPPHAAEYAAFVNRNTDDDAANDLVGARVFFRSDYVVYRRPTWCATLRMSSRRVIGGETVNDENLSGLHLGDGAMLVYRTGREYQDIFPVWDWRMVPGTTAAQDTSSLRWRKVDLKKGTAFVGGASDGTNAVVAMDFRRDGLSAKKAWFFCGDAVVCLGADVKREDEGTRVVTTAEQCLLHGEVAVERRSGAREVVGKEDIAGRDIAAVEHDGVRYAFLTPEEVTVSAGERTGDWAKVFRTPATPKGEVTKGVLTVAVDHGVKPEGGTYAYSIAPAKMAGNKVEVVANEAAVQAVRVGEQWWGAVFWKAGDVKLAGVRVAVDRPCVLCLGADGRVAVADPAQELDAVTVDVGDVSLKVALPQGAHAGESVVVKIR